VDPALIAAHYDCLFKLRLSKFSYLLTIEVDVGHLVVIGCEWRTIKHSSGLQLYARVEEQTKYPAQIIVVHTTISKDEWQVPLPVHYSRHMRVMQR